MENPLADYRREKKIFNGVVRQTSLTKVQLHDVATLKNKKKLIEAIKEIRDFANILEEKLKQENKL